MAVAVAVYPFDSEKPASAFLDSRMNAFGDESAREWLAEHWVYEAVVTVGERVYWNFVSKEDGFPWGDYYVEATQ